MSDLPTVDVKIKVEGPGLGNTRVFFDGIEVTGLLMAEPFEVRFATDDSQDPYLVVGLPIGELDLDIPNAAVQAIAVDEQTGEVA